MPAGTVSGGSDRAQAELEMRRCRANVAAGDLRHAASHLGLALVHDPAHEDAYASLNDLVEAAGSCQAARELFKGDGTGISPGNAAAIIALLAAEGQVASAVELLGSAVAANPAKPWAAAPWFSPDLATTLPPISIGRALTAVWEAIGNPAPPETTQALTPWLALARTAASRHGLRPDVLCAASALARRLNAHQEAIEWCRTAEEREKQSSGGVTQHTLIMLGYAYRDAGEPEEAIKTWTRASAAKSANPDLFLDLADITFDQGDVAQSLRWAERAAAHNGSSIKVKAALLAARFRASAAPDGLAGDVAPLISLVDLLAAHSESSYLRKSVSRACNGLPWLKMVPPPTEAVSVAYGEFAQGEESGEATIVSGTTYLSGLESPTAMAIFRARFAQLSLEIGPLAEPDLRVPVKTEFGPPLWSYDGTTAVPAVEPPSPQAVALLHEVAKGIWADPLVAYDQAAGFAELDADDLLGLLAHVPPPLDPSWIAIGNKQPLYWQRLAQVWVCVGLLHHRPEEPWPQSARRTLLLRLQFGPEDWTVDAAAFALCVSAWRFPAQRAEIAEAITQRYLQAAEAVGRRPTQLHDPLARVLLICPDVDPNAVRQARKTLADLREAAGAADAAQINGSLLRRLKRRKDG